MWQCSRCRELIADSFDACWNCGTERTGAAPSAFVPEPSDASVPDPGPSPEDLYVADAEEHPVGEGGPEEHPIEHRATGRRPVRFQFSLRTLFLLNFLAACVLGGIKVLTTQKPASEFLSPCLWSLGALSIIFLAAMGDAVGRDWGAVVGSLLGLGIWVLMLWASYENQIPLYLPAQTWPWSAPLRQSSSPSFSACAAETRLTTSCQPLPDYCLASDTAVIGSRDRHQHAWKGSGARSLLLSRWWEDQ